MKKMLVLGLLALVTGLSLKGFQAEPPGRLLGSCRFFNNKFSAGQLIPQANTTYVIYITVQGAAYLAGLGYAAYELRFPQTEPSSALNQRVALSKLD